jgi:hypothetical protein
MSLLTKMPRRVLLLRRLTIARNKRIAGAHESAEREGAMRRLLDQATAPIEQP